MNGRGFITISMRTLDRLKLIQSLVDLGLKPQARSRKTRRDVGRPLQASILNAQSLPTYTALALPGLHMASEML